MAMKKTKTMHIPRETPLQQFAKDAPSVFMREVARLALVRSLNQESLARMLNIASANVRRYFEAKRPKPQTIKQFADLLAIDEQYLRLLRNEPLLDEELGETEQRVLYEVRTSGFKANAVAAVRDFLRSESAQVREKVLAAYLLAQHRVENGLAPDLLDWPKTVSPALANFGDTVKGRFDLRSYLHTPQGPNDSFFLDMYDLMMDQHAFSHDEAEKFLDLIRAAFRMQNRPFDHMDLMLHGSLTYKTAAFQHAGYQRTNARRFAKGNKPKKEKS